MNPDKLLLLREEVDDLDKAAGYLEASLARSSNLAGRRTWSEEELERLESLTSRFARVADLLIQRVMRLVDELELMPPGTLLDRLNHAEKRGWVDRAAQLRRIREVRNTIAHEYADEKLAEVYAMVFDLAPLLLAVVPKVSTYAGDLIRQLEASDS